MQSTYLRVNSRCCELCCPPPVATETQQEQPVEGGIDPIEDADQ